VCEDERWAGNVACIGEVRKVYKVLAGEPEGKRIDLREICLRGVGGGFSWLGIGTCGKLL
jgi:hypothetical protein